MVKGFSVFLGADSSAGGAVSDTTMFGYVPVLATKKVV